MIYNLTYNVESSSGICNIADKNVALPTFITISPASNNYNFLINSPSQVGIYKIMLYSTIGNNMSTSVQFTAQIKSPCLGVVVTVPALSVIPIYDLADSNPLYIDLNWNVENPSTPSCGPINFVFTLFN